MKCVIDSHVVLSQAPQGPLAVHIEPFAKSLREQGYARYSIHRHVLLAACFSRWLANKESPSVSSPSSIPRGICDTALGRCSWLAAMRLRSGICSPFCAVRA